MIQRVISTGTAFLMLALLAGPAGAAIPGADDPKAFTEHDLRRLKLEHNRRTLRGVYDASGRKNPAWDAEAGKFLDDIAVYFANGGAAARYMLPNNVPSAELAKAGRALREKGCDDPLVVYCVAAMTDDAGRSAGKPDSTVKPLLRETLDPLVKDPYPPLRACAAASRLLRHLDVKTEIAERERVLDVLREAALRVVSSGDYKDLDRRLLWVHVSDELTSLPLDEQKLMYDAMLQLPTADPWFVNTFGGHYLLDAAWKARGGGYADTVTDEGWKQFFELQARARDLLVKAYEIDPRLPEPAAEMIRLAMGAGEHLGESPREWFEKTVKAQLDYPSAYSRMLWLLRPRWGGSHERMYAFGLECLATRRFDTRIPWQFIVALEEIADDDEGRYTFWQRPGVYEKLAEALDGEIALAAHKDNPWYPSYKAAVAWRTRHFKEALPIVDQLGPKLSPEPFTRVGVWRNRAIEEIRASGGPLGEDVEAAEKQYRHGFRLAAVQQFKALAGKAEPDQPEGRFIRARADEIDRELAFARGEWVDIQPGAGLAGWYAINGKWSVDGDALVGVCQQPGLSLVLHQRFGRRFEWTGTIEFVDPVPRGVAGGPIVAYHGNRDNYTLLLEPDAKQAVLQCSYNHRDVAPAEVAASNTFEVRAYDGVVSIRVNGKDAIDRFKLKHRIGERDAHIGLGLVRPVRGTTLRFSNLKIRRLDEPLAAAP